VCTTVRKPGKCLFVEKPTDFKRYKRPLALETLIMEEGKLFVSDIFFT
jgi:hypothetical protein